jgi:hypothetical protein
LPLLDKTAHGSLIHRNDHALIWTPNHEEVLLRVFQVYFQGTDPHFQLVNFGLLLTVLTRVLCLHSLTLKSHLLHGPLSHAQIFFGPGQIEFQLYKVHFRFTA